MIRRFAGAACAALAFALPALAQSDYPSRTVTMIVPFPPGGVADITARPVAEAMGRHLKQTGHRREQVRRRRRRRHAVRRAREARRLHGAARALLDLHHPGSRQDPRPRADVPARASSCRSRASRPTRRCSPCAPTARGRARRRCVEAAKKAPGAIPYGSSGNYGTMHVPMEMLARRGGREDAARAVHRRAAPRSWRCWAAASTRSPRARRRSWAT